MVQVVLTLFILLAATFAEGREGHSGEPKNHSADSSSVAAKGGFSLDFGETSASPPELGHLPVFYKGRVRPLDSCARLWMNEVYHRETLLSEHKETLQFYQDSPVDFLWFLQSSYNPAVSTIPFFWIEEEEIKSLLNLESGSVRFSFEELRYAVEDVIAINLKIIEQMIIRSFFKISQGTTFSAGQKLHLKIINADIECHCFDQKLVVTSAPTLSPWHFLSSLCCRRPYTIELSREQPALCNKSLCSLILHFLQFKELRRSHSLLNALLYSPFSRELIDHSSPKISEISSVYDSIFRSSGQSLTKLLAHFFLGYHAALREGLLAYPTLFQLIGEEAFVKYPILRASAVLYGLSLFCFFACSMRSFRKKFGKSNALLLRKIAWAFLTAGFLLHGVALLYKAVFFLNPPLSTLFDSVLFVAWLSILIGVVFFAIFRSRFPILGALICTEALFLFLLALNAQDSFATTDPAFKTSLWRSVRITMMDLGYGILLLGGILGHLSLISSFKSRRMNASLLSRCIVHCIYFGSFFLVIGCLLGGLWGDSGWGSFRNWDPAESFAFISICFYLTLIHLNHFKWVGPFASALGACCGIVAFGISWYGVNFFMEEGLQTFGKGSGGEMCILAFLALEVFFIVAVLFQKKRLAAS